MKLLTTGTALAVAAMLAACTPDTRVEGYHIDPTRLEQLQPGASTRDEVQGLLGSPSSIATFRQNSDTWYYISKEIESVTQLDAEVVAQQVVAIDFDQTGRVEKIRRYQLNDAKEVTPVGRTTPTQGQELGVFEQLLSNLVGRR